MVHSSPYPPIDIPSVPLPRFVLQHAARREAKTALIEGVTGRAVTYGALLQSAMRTAAGLAGRGIRKGDVVAIYSPNTPDYPVAFHGAALAGAVVTTVNPLYNAIEVAHQLRDADVRTLIASPETLQTARSAAVAAGVADLYVFGDGPGAVPFGSLLACEGPVPDVAIDPREDVVAVLYTSATTGLPKGVMLTHYNIVANIIQGGPLQQMRGDEVVLAVMPFHHIYGFSGVMNGSLYAGATLVTLPGFDLHQFLAAIERHAVTTAYVVPPIVRALATHPLVDRYNLSSLRDVVSGAAPLAERVARACAERLGCLVRQSYGLTETSPTTHHTPRNRVKLASVGVALPNTEFRIVDVACKEDVEGDQLGEVWVRGPQIMKGYLNNPEITRRMIDGEGWLHTGDIGYADADGHLYVVDRAKDLVKFRGLQYRDDELLMQMIEDITARRKDEERLQFQALLLDSVRESIVGTDVDHRITFWNKGAETLFGYTAQEALGAPVESLILPADAGTFSEIDNALAQLAISGQWQGQVRRRRKDGAILWTDVVVSVVTGRDGQRSGLIAIHRDITELRRNQEMLTDSHARLQDLTARLIDVREHERAAIARELHDELGQALTRLNIDLSWLTDQLPSRLQTRRVAAMLPLVDRMLGTVQHLSSLLRPAILDDLGLEAALEWQAQEFQQWNGCRCRLSLAIGPLAPDRDRDTAVFRIFQEALTNVARHARAKSVRIAGAVDEADELVLEVEDDGVGIPEPELTSNRALGLLGMRERARGVGGSVEFRRGSRRGTLIRLRVPIGAAAGEKHR
jgi:PAS domain S-box-containing protein